MSPLGFKARVGSALFELGGGVHVTCFLKLDVKVNVFTFLETQSLKDIEKM